jgi:hypothetical protein
VAAQQSLKSRLILMVDEAPQELPIRQARFLRQEHGPPKVREDAIQVDRHGLPFLSDPFLSLSITSGSGLLSYIIFVALAANFSADDRRNGLASGVTNG